MSSTGMRCIDDLGTEHFDDDWNLFGLEDDPLKGGSPPPSTVLDVNLGLNIPVRSCPSPLAQIPTREPFGMEAPPKLSPVPTEQEQTFTTLSTHVPDSSQQYVAAAPRSLADYENDLAEELGLEPCSSAPNSYMQPTTSSSYMQAATSVQSAPMQSASPIFNQRQQNDVHMMQPSTSGAQHNGAVMQQQQSSQQQQQACIQTVNGQWFVPAQVQHVQTSSGTVIAVVPNFSRGQGENNIQQSGVARQSPQQLAPQPINYGMMNAQQQQQQGHHVMQQQQQPQHHQVLQPAKPVNTSGIQSQGHPVVQQLLSAPALPRQQMQQQQQPLAPQTTPGPAAKTKQRAAQPRSNGRKKNAGQNGTLGSFLTKANRLAAASNGSTNESARSSHESVTLSVQNSEQVAKLTKEIGRLQTLQATQNVDCSREIKELESRRAQIFFAALVEQHKNDDILSAASGQAKPPPRPAASRQRNNAYGGGNGRAQQVHSNVLQIQHQVQPSTSYERQPVYETIQPQQQQQPRSYTTSYHQVQYQTYQQPSNRNTYSSVQSSTHAQQAPVQQQQQQYYHGASTVRQDACNTYQTYEQGHASSPSLHQVPMQQTSSVVSQATGSVQQPFLVSPPRLRSTAEAAACVNEKKQQRISRLGDYFSALQKNIETVDVSKPFEDLPDVVMRLFPFHSYHEPDLSSKVVDQFDTDYLRHMVHLNERKDRVEKRLRTILFNEAMKGTVERMDECVLLSLDGEYESRVLDEERRMSTQNPKEIVGRSRMFMQLNPDEIRARKLALDKTAHPKPQMPFEYHAFSEAEILARDRGSLEEPENGMDVGRTPYDEESSEEETSSYTEESEESVSTQDLVETKNVPKIWKPTESKERSATKMEVPSLPKVLSPNKPVPVPEKVALVTKDAEKKSLELPRRQVEKSKPLPPSSAVKLRLNGVSTGIAGPLVPKELSVKPQPSKEMNVKCSLPKESAVHPLPSRNLRQQPPQTLKQSPQAVKLSEQKQSPIKDVGRAEALNLAVKKEPPQENKMPSLSTLLKQNKGDRSIASLASTSSVTPAPISASGAAVEKKQDETPKCRSLKEKLKRHWHEEMSSEKKVEPTKASGEKLRFRFRSLVPPPLEKTVEAVKGVDEFVESSPSPELIPGTPSTLAPRTSVDEKSNNSQKRGEKKTLESISEAARNEEVKGRAERGKVPEKPETNGLVPGAIKIKCNFRVDDENAKFTVCSNEMIAEKRPPIKIKIALPTRITENNEQSGDDEKKEKKKKKKKKKHHHAKGEKRTAEDLEYQEHDLSERPVSYCDVVPNCSTGLSEAARPPSAANSDDPSRGRLLFRFSRKENNVLKCEPAASPASSCTTQGTNSGDTPTNTTVEDAEPKPKIPKLKIRFGGSSQGFGTVKSEAGASSACGKDERGGVATRTDRQKGRVGVSGVNASTLKTEVQRPKHEVGPVKMEIVDTSSKREAPPVSTAAPVSDKCAALTLNLFPSSSTSTAQFSPASDASDVEEEKRLRLQTDNVMNRLNGWTSGIPVTTQMQAEALSRIVNNATFMNPLLSGLMPPTMSPWLANIDQAAAGYAAARNFPWLMQPSLLQQGPPSQHHKPTSFEKSEFKR